MARSHGIAYGADGATEDTGCCQSSVVAPRSDGHHVEARELARKLGRDDARRMSLFEGILPVSQVERPNESPIVRAHAESS